MARSRKSNFERLNRRQRRNLKERLFSPDPGLQVVNANAAGIDVGNESHYVAVPGDRDAEPVREFGCWTAALKQMCQWLVSCGIDTVAMQATGVYWIALCDELEVAGIRVVVANGEHTKNMPGRKSDVQECQWLMKLHTFGLLRDSFRLDQQVLKIRGMWRLRARHIEEAGRAVQHMQKAMTTMNVQLANVISDISGVSGRAIIDAILDGERDPYQLADLCNKRIQASREEVARSLEGTWREDLVFELGQARESYDFAHKRIQDCDEKLQQYVAALPARVVNGVSAQSVPPSKSRRRAKPRGNAPAWDLKSELERITGVNLTSIEGIDVMTACTIVAELGPDLSAFADEHHFASWLGLTPNKRITGGKVIGRDRRHGRNRVAGALRMAASTLKQSRSWLGGFYRHKCRVLPSKCSAVKATAHYLAKLVYRLMSYGQAWVDRGVENFQKRREQLYFAALSKTAQARGYTLVPIKA